MITNMNGVNATPMETQPGRGVGVGDGGVCVVVVVAGVVVVVVDVVVVVADVVVVDVELVDEIGQHVQITHIGLKLGTRVQLPNSQNK